MVNGGGYEQKNERTNGRTDILKFPCVLHNIGPLGPLPKKYEQYSKQIPSIHYQY